MRSTVIDRRGLLAGTAAAGAAWLVPVSAGSATDLCYLAACRRGDGSHAVAGLAEDGSVVFSETLAGRGHDIAVAPDGASAVVFARRPGRFALVIDLRARRAVRSIVAAPDRHFYGHGFFSADGRLLHATENAYDREAGMLGLYDVEAGYRRIGELSTGGIGPHEALLMPDGRTIAIANGGILTHPDTGRRKLNLPTMRPSLTYLDAATGDIVDQIRLAPELHQLSLRHMSVDRTGAVWFGGQHEGPAGDRVALVGTHRPGGEPAMIAASAEMADTFRNYIGSVAANRAGSRIATTSPRAGHAVIWDVASRNVVGQISRSDISGVAPGNREGFMLTSGTGDVGATDGAWTAHGKIAWDNHLREAACSLRNT